MKRSLPIGRIVILLLICLASQSPLWAQSKPTVYEGVIRLKVKPELVASTHELATTLSNGVVLTGVPSLDRLCQQYTATKIQRVFPYNPKNEDKHRKHGLHLWYELTFSSGEDAIKVASAYASLSEITRAEPLYVTKLIKGEFTPAGEAAPTTAALPFNDPYLSKQWHYHNTGDYEGLVGSDINLFEAWKVTAGKPSAVVSVHDEGVDYTHEDLAANMWKNLAELNGTPNVDDDNNGYIDDVYGFNFTNHSGKIDKMEHGTHVSGTIAAVNNNGKGVGGIAGGTGTGDGARIMSCQILGTDGSNIPASYVYAADNGSLISQNSWGYTTPGFYEQATNDAIDYFIAEAGNFTGSPMRGGVVLFAAGNNDSDEMMYPGAYESVIAVSALGPNSKKAWYSNFGSWVEIASYGGDDTKHAQNQVLSTIPNNGYAFMQGTSMATPHISGICALILSKHGGPTFTNQQLITHLLTGVRDVDSFNPDFIGTLGVGISDAALAVASDSGIGPNKIADLELTGISQDFATLEWSVPTDPDDQLPVKFKVYYSTDPITPANLASATELTITNKSNPGATISYEVDDLQSTTTYYFMVLAFDRWGNTSSFSNSVNGITNEGPTISLDKEQSDILLDASAASLASDQFNILNTGAGVLKWTALFRHKSLYLPFDVSKLHYPVLTARPASVTINIGKQHLKAKTAGVPIEGGDFQQTSMDYYDPYGPTYVIGEEDLSVTNSSATKFKVSAPEGFNLTQVQSLLAHDNNHGPVIMEVYLGSSLKSAVLTYAMEVTSYDKSPYWHYIDLDENIFLEKGAEFWIVFHVPAGNKFPLGMGLEREDQFSENCFLSNDLGKTWIPMEVAVDDDRWVFAISAVTGQPSLGNYMTITPEASQVLSGESQPVTIGVDGTTLKNGSYSADVVISSNDKDHKLVKFPVNLEVSNHKPVLQVADISEFGSVFVGTEKSIEIPVSNIGYGDFSQLTLTVSDPQFELVDYAPWKIAARMVETIKFKFKPAQTGNANATVTLLDVDGNSHEFYLNGVGSEPPVIELTPAVATVNNIHLGDDFKTTVSIGNTGKYPLKYAFSKFADANTLAQFGTDIQKFGYSYTANLDGTGQPAYNFTDISSEPNVIGELTKNPYYAVDLGFDFPFYGKTYSKIFITQLGALTFADDAVIRSSSGRIGDPSSPSGYITAAWWFFDPKAGGAINYKRLPGKMIVEYNGIVSNDPVQGKWPATFEITLFDNGDIDIAYEDLTSWGSFDLSYYLIGLDDPMHQDGYKISDVYAPLPITSHSIIHIHNPGIGALKAVSSVTGTVPVGGSKDVELTFGTAALREGAFSDGVSILSNDPFHNPAQAEVDFTISTGGVPLVTVDQDTIDFKQVFRSSQQKVLVAIQNSGTKDVSLSTLSVTGTNYTLDKTAPLVLKARQTQYVTVTLKTTTLGIFKSTLTVRTNKGQLFKIPLSAEVIAEPIISIDITSIDKSLAAGDSTKVTMLVTNSGKSDLEIVTQGTDWLYVPDSGGANKTYSWITSLDNGGPTYNWIDIRRTGVLLDSLDPYAEGRFWKGVKLPFSFTFYGKSYDSLFIGANGVVNFTKDDTNYPFEASDIPSPENPNNFIAPLWIPGGPNGYIYSDAGVYYQLFADKIVVTYWKFGNVFSMGDPISFQLILYSNGNMKFQYDLGTFDLTSYLGMIGVENEDGTDGVLIAYHEHLLRNKMAIFLQPASKRIIPAQSAQNLTALVDARYLYAGSYSGNLQLRNNSPANPVVTIPGTLQVSGVAALEWPDSLAFGQVMPYLEEDENGIMSDKVYYQYFNISNTGKDVAALNGFAFKNSSSELTVETQVEDPFFGGVYWTNVNDLWDPLTVVPDGSLTLRMRLLPLSEAHEIVDTLVVADNLPEGTFSIPVKATVVLPPVLILTPPELTVQANEEATVETKQFVIDNTTGSSTLTYSMSLEYFRSQPDVTAAKVKTQPESVPLARIATSAPTLVAAPIVNSTSARTNEAQATSLTDYHLLLQYDSLKKSDIQLGYNGQAPFWCASLFQAPDEGFTLSHAITWYLPGTWLSSDIVVEVRGGSSDITKTTLLYTQDYNYTITEPDNKGLFLEIKLDEPQIFYPGEKFFVVVKYPLGTLYPQGTAILSANLPKTFYYSAGDGDWSDLTAGFPNYAWIIKAAEITEPASGWASFTGTLTGEVEAGQQQSIDVVFDSRLALNADNYATVKIASNDPYAKDAKVQLLLHRNQGPVFEKGETASFTIAEDDTLSYVIHATDPENDNFQYSFTAPSSNVKLVADGQQATLTFVTNFDMEGEYEFHVQATDVFNHTTTHTVSVLVTHVNRAPKLIKPLAELNLRVGGDAAKVDLDEFFQDQDGDALTFVSVASSGVATIFEGGQKIMISPDEVGDCSITVTATDSEGATVTGTFAVRVGTVSGIADRPADFNVTAYPNPTNDKLYLHFTGERDPFCTIKVMNTVGMLISESKAGMMSDHDVEMNLGTLSPGVYIIEISDTSGKRVRRVMKN